MAKPPHTEQIPLFETSEPSAPPAPAPREAPPAKASPRTGKRTPPVAAKRKVSGLVPEGDVRLTANIREDLHLRLKIAAARQRTTIGELIEGLVERYL